MDMQSAIALGAAIVAAIGWIVTINRVNVRLRWMELSLAAMEMRDSLELQELNQELSSQALEISQLKEKLGSLSQGSVSETPETGDVSGPAESNAFSYPLSMRD